MAAKQAEQSEGRIQKGNKTEPQALRSQTENGARRILLPRSATANQETTCGELGVANCNQFTVKFVVLDALPPGVVTTILPVTAPVGTVAVTCVSEFTVKVVAAMPPNVTFVV